MTRRQALTAGLAAALLTTALTGCGVPDRHDTTPPGDVPSTSPTVGTRDAEAPGPEPREFSTPADRARPDHVVRLEGLLTRLYDAPSLTAFAAQHGCSNVIVGDVVKLQSTVSQPGNTVETLLFVDVVRQRERGRPTRVRVREQGGVVAMGSVRSDFEDKLGRKLTAEEMTETVDYRFDGLPHAEVGDRVLVIAADDGSAAARYVALARLATADATTGDPSSSVFSWPGVSPNPRWQESVRGSSLLRPIRR